LSLALYLCRALVPYLLNMTGRLVV
jgi:hypothetical protein